MSTNTVAQISGRIFGYLANGVLILLVAIGAFYEVTHQDPMPRKASAPPPRSFTVYSAGAWSEPAVAYDDKTLTLTVGPHAPFTLLICIRGTCELADGWRVK